MPRPAGIQPRMRRFHVVGTFHSGMYEYDRALALIEPGRRGAALSAWATASRACGSRSLIRSRRRSWCAALAVALGGGFYVSDWTRNHANFFRSIEITKSMLFLILLLVVAVAAFNIVAALVMVVKDKRSRTSRSCARSAPARATSWRCSRSRERFIGLAGTARRRGCSGCCWLESRDAGARPRARCSAPISWMRRSTS